MTPDFRKSTIFFTPILIVLLQTFAIAQDSKPHVVFIAGEEEYGAHWTLPKIAYDLETRFNIKATVIHSWRSGVHDYDMPGTIEIPEYDEIENLEIIKGGRSNRHAHPLSHSLRLSNTKYCKSTLIPGKPAIAFRTTSHGFWPADRKDWFVPFFGGHYKGHMPNTEGTTTMVPAEQLDHPLLRGVPKRKSMNDVMGIYITAPLNDSATPLMMGKTGLIGPAQPVTWINEYRKDQKIFYTSLGGLESFIDPGFINMIYNAVFWALDREVPENGVLDIDEISDYENEPPFEKYAFRGSQWRILLNDPRTIWSSKMPWYLMLNFRSSTIPPPPATKYSPQRDRSVRRHRICLKWRHWDLSADPVAMLPDARAVSPSPIFNEARWSVLDNILLRLDLGMGAS